MVFTSFRPKMIGMQEHALRCVGEDECLCEGLFGRHESERDKSLCRRPLPLNPSPRTASIPGDSNQTNRLSPHNTTPPSPSFSLPYLLYQGGRRWRALNHPSCLRVKRVAGCPQRTTAAALPRAHWVIVGRTVPSVDLSDDGCRLFITPPRQKPSRALRKQEERRRRHQGENARQSHDGLPR